MSDGQGRGPEDDVRRLWQDQPVELPDVPVDVIQRRVAALDRTVRARDLREYLAGALVAVPCLAGAFAPGSPAYLRVAAVATLVGGGWTLRHLWQHGRSKPVQPAAGAATSDHLDFLRARLEAQRSLLASAWRWYLAPIAPGPLILLAGVAMSAPRAIRALPTFWVTIGGTFAIVAAVFVGIGWLNARAARKMAEEIRALGGRLEVTMGGPQSSPTPPGGAG